MASKDYRYLQVIIFYSVMISLLNLAGIFSANLFTWGFNYWSLFDPLISVLTILFILAIVFLIIFKFNNIAFGKLSNVFQAPPGAIKNVVAVIFLFALFYLFRVKTMVFGDGITLLGSLAEGEDITLVNQHYLQIGALYFNFYGIKLLTSVFPVAASEAFSILNIFGGIVGVFAIRKIASTATDNKSKQFLVVLGSATGATVILFFGYIENYIWATSLGLWTLYYSIIYYKSRKHILPLILSSILTILFHLIALPYFVLAMIVILSKPVKKINFFIENKYSDLILALISVIIVFIVSYFELAKIFVPFASTSYSHYTVFSVEHIADLLNHLLLCAPFGLFLIFYFLTGRARKSPDSSEERILFLAFVLNFLVAFWIDPELGAVRDWDILSFYSFPLTIWALVKFIRILPEAKTGSYNIAFALVIIITLFPNLYSKNSPSLSVNYLDDLLWDDHHYSNEYKNGSRQVSWGYLIYEYENESDRAMKYFRRRLSKFNCASESAYHIGRIFMMRNQYDSADVYLDIAVRCSPDETRYLNYSSGVKLKLNKTAEASQLFEKLIKLEPDNPRSRFTYGMTLLLQNNITDAALQFKETYRLDNSHFNSLLTLGDIYNHSGQFDSSYKYLNILKRDHPNRQELYPKLITTLKSLGKSNESVAAWQTLKNLNPNYRGLDSIYNSITD